MTYNPLRAEPTEAEQYGIMHQIRRKYGVVSDTDSYKLSHHPQYPQGADAMISYFAARGGARDRVMMYGAQLLIKEYFLQRLTMRQARNMVKWAEKHMNGNVTADLEIALTKVVNELDGRLPIRIRTAPEGLMIPIKNVLLTIETSIPGEEWFSLVSYFETKLVRVWSPMTVATTSWYVRQEIMKNLEITCDNPSDVIPFMFHDFGSRGVGGMEVAAFAGSGHLVSFMGTDTDVAVQAIEFGYNMEMAGFSIPASEHSTTTMHGHRGEAQLVSQMFDNYAKPGGIFATVIDSYDWLNFIRVIGPMFKERLIKSGAKWVFRPDSGHPIKTPVKCVEELGEIFGYRVNNKGYKVLKYVGVIQGDGITPPQIGEIQALLMSKGWSVENIAFGMGGGLLQKNNRDTHKFALKCCAVRINGQWVEVQKDPAVYDEETWERLKKDSFKKSQGGRLELVYNFNTGEYRTLKLEEAQELVDGGDWKMILETRFDTGYIHNEIDFKEVRLNAGTFI